MESSLEERDFIRNYERREEQCLLSWNVLVNGVFVRGKQRESDLLKALGRWEESYSLQPILEMM
jgi:hypothetical protein